MNDKPYDIIERPVKRLDGTIARCDYHFKSLVNDHSGPNRYTKADAESDGEAFMKVLPEVLAGKIYPIFEIDDEVYTDWYYCPACGNANIQRKFKFCPGCGKELSWKE